MKSSKYYIASIKYGLIGLISYLLLNTYYILPVYAADASPSADIQAKIQQLKSEIASKAAQIKSQVDAKLQNRAWLGQIQSKTDSQIILAGEDKNRTVLINKFTDSPDKLKKDDFIIALGDIDDKGNLVARKLVSQPTPTPLTAKYLWGKVLDASASGMLIRDNNDKDQQIAITKDTNLDNLKLVTPDSIIIAVADSIKGSLQARYIYQVRQGQPSPKPASSSATPSAKKR